MTVQVKDLPTNQQKQTVANRLRVARDNRGLSRGALASLTGIPASTIEKFERGTMEPSVSRLEVLSECLGVSANWITTGKDQAVSSDEKHVVDSPETVTQEEEAKPPLKPQHQVTVLLERLDDYRHFGFEGAQRSTLALIEEVRSLLRRLEVGELIALAESRELYEDENCELAVANDLFAEEPTTGQEYCSKIEERIIDTAILGVDLYWIELEALETIAEEMEIEAPSRGFFGFQSWDDHADIVPEIRDELRNDAMTENQLNFNDTDEFPRRN